MITIKDMLKEMESGRVFSLSVVSYDHKRGTGGELINYPEAVLLTNKASQKTATRPPTRKEKLEIAIKKNPRHSHWYTRNIRICSNGVPTSIIKKIHPALVTLFNGEKIIV